VRLGTYDVTAVGGEVVRAYVPRPLPPDPPLDLAPLQRPIERASQALGRLDGLAALLPDPQLVIYYSVRREAVFSSQIEGTQSSLSDLLLFELHGGDDAGVGDVREVSSYVAALDHGLTRLRTGFPLSLRLLREIHAVLLRDGRGSTKAPGEFRRSQNWIGGSRPGDATFVPPPHHRVVELMGQLELYLHDASSPLPTIVKAALAHVQFETIHPFLDGNGRLGRLLITFLLCAEGALREPLLYLSLYLKQHRQEYYDLLQRVRLEGAWEAWLAFFLQGVSETASEAATTATTILRVFEEDRHRLDTLGRAAPTALRVHRHFQRQPVSSVRHAAAALGLAFPTAGAAIDRLIDLGILREMTGRRRDRIFANGRYLDLLSEGTEPLPR
jgi:Fic family protein